MIFTPSTTTTIKLRFFFSFFFFFLGWRQSSLAVPVLSCAVFIYLFYIFFLYMCHSQLSWLRWCWWIFKRERVTTVDRDWKYWVVCVFTFNLSSCHLNNQHNGPSGLVFGYSSYTFRFINPIIFFLTFNFFWCLLTELEYTGRYFSFSFSISSFSFVSFF